MLTDKEKLVLWKHGKLKYLLMPNQREVYDHFQTWLDTAISNRANKIPDQRKYKWLYVFDCSRRYGKDFVSLLILIEKAIQRKNGLFTYAAAHQKEISEIATILLPQIIEDCPDHMAPVYRNGFKGKAQGIYFPNGSLIKLVGLDLNPDGIRGRHSDGIVLSETGFISDVSKTIETVLEAQFMGRPHGFLLCNSTPPEAGAHDWDTELCPDARDYGAYIFRTIWDSHYSDYEKREFLKIQPDGSIPNRQRREYLCERIREETKVVVPEFTKARHVREFEIPKFAQCYVGIDPAVTDLTAVNFCVYDFEHNRLLVLDEITGRNLNTGEVAAGLKQKEALYFNKLHYWDGKKLVQNPYLRVTDIDPGGSRMLLDLGALFGIRVTPADKSGKDASLQALRLAFQNEQILIHPRCKNTIEHLEGAIWNKARASYERSERLGHADHVDVLKYLWRGLNRHTNPFPPQTWHKIQEHGTNELYYQKAHLVSKNSLTSKLSSLFPARWTKKDLHGVR